MLEYIILGVLTEKPYTGYDIRKCVEEGIGMFYKASWGSIYPLLGRLSEQGRAACREECQGSRKKKVYYITPEGREAFARWLEGGEETEDSMEAFIAKSFFFDQLPDELAEHKIQEYEKKAEAYLERLMEKKMEFDGLVHKDSWYYKLSTLYFGICKLQSMIAWCRAAKEKADLNQLILPLEELGCKIL